MKVRRYFAALFVAGILSVTPVLSIAEDDSDNRNHPSGDEYGERAREDMMEHRDRAEWNSEHALAQLPDEEPFGTTYCFTEAIIDESTGEVVAARQICEEPMLDLG